MNIPSHVNFVFFKAMWMEKEVMTIIMAANTAGYPQP